MQKHELVSRYEQAAAILPSRLRRAALTLSDEEKAAAEGKEKGVKGLPAKLGMEMAAEMIARIKDEKLCPGVHIMAIGAEKNVPAILEMAGVKLEA